MLRKVFFTLVLAVLLTGCAGTGVSQAATELTVEATDFAYTPASITVPAGQPVTLTLNNTGAVEHDFVVDKINVTDVEASDNGPAMHHQMGGDAPDYDLHFFAGAGDTAVLKFTALEPGTYEIFCSIEGHKAAGMIGKLIVVDQE
jgi:uncharacterized cupredoxin-like copper-binding protein